MNTLQNLADYLKSTFNETGKEIVNLEKKRGDRGAWLLIHLANGDTESMPVGGSEKSQNGKLADYKVVIAKDGTAIATIGSYLTEETMSFGTVQNDVKKEVHVEPVMENVQTDNLPF